MRILLAAITCQKGDLEANLASHAAVLAEAQRAGCDLALFPEMSLTGSVDPVRHPERSVSLEGQAVQQMVALAKRNQVAAVFGIAERHPDGPFISQVYACDGHLLGIQRKRRLGEDEEGFAVSVETGSFQLGAGRFGVVVCAESCVAHTWDASAAGAPMVLFASAPGLYGRRIDAAGWRDGLDWWESAGLADAKHHAQRLGVWVAMTTQAGLTSDEDFPGLAALVAPDGEVVTRLPDHRAGTLVVDVPITVAVEPIRHAIRVLVVDRGGRALLAHFGDDHPRNGWWMPPGGGTEPGEDDLETARRELFEELGRDDLEIGPLLGHRGATFLVGGGWCTQHERWYLCRSQAFEVVPEVVERARAEGIRDLRWWSVADLRSGDPLTSPRNLADLLEAILAGRLPDPQADLGR